MSPLRSCARVALLTCTLLGLHGAAGTVALAQPPHADHAAHATHAAGPDSLTAVARRQLDEARRAVAPYATPAAAIAAGYRPVFGQVPLQGEHYVRTDLVFGGSFDVARPSVLMFAPVRGTPTLVGMAYAFLQPTDAPTPTGFDGLGADVWHAHDGLVPMPGRRLVMMHVWLTDTPDGPFARYNPWLPFRAAGLVPPTAATLADTVAGTPARRLGFALALATQPPLLFTILERRGTDALRTAAARERAAIAALVPALVAAERAGDRTRYDAVAQQAIAAADAFAAAHRDAAGAGSLGARLVDRTVDEFMGRGHGIEEELGALLRGGATAPATTHRHDPSPMPSPMP